MKDITAIILAAGLGVRMGPRGRLQPKGLIEIGGVPLVRQSVETLWSRGIDEIVVVTGHLSEQYEAAFAGDPVRLVHNPHYATTGSLRTLAVGLEGVAGPCLILESDLIYAPQALDVLSETETCLLTSGATGAGDEVYVWTRPQPGGSEQLVEISKRRAALPQAPYGELVGITALNADAAARMPAVAARVLARNPEEHYEHGLVALAHDTGLPVRRIDDLAWAEIDDEAMLARAVARVFPRVVAARREDRRLRA